MIKNVYCSLGLISTVFLRPFHKLAATKKITKYHHLNPNFIFTRAVLSVSQIVILKTGADWVREQANEGCD